METEGSEVNRDRQSEGEGLNEKKTDRPTEGKKANL